MQKPKFIYFDFNKVLAEQCIDRDTLTAELLNLKTAEYKKIALQTALQPEIKRLWEKLRTVDDENAYFEAYFKEVCVRTNRALNAQLQKDIINSRTILSYTLRNGVKELLFKLQPFFGLGIITNARPSRRTVEIERLGLTQYIPHEHILISTEQGYAKPDYEIYRKAIEVSGVEAAEIVYCDDRVDCLKAAAKVGIEHVVLFSESPDSKYFTVQKSALELLEYPPIKEVMAAIT